MVMELIPIKQLPKILKERYNFTISYTGLVWYRKLRLLPNGYKQGKNNLYNPEDVYEFIRIAKILGTLYCKDMPEVADLAEDFRDTVKLMKKDIKVMKRKYGKANG